MKKLLLLTIVLFTLFTHGYSQFSATLAGYPLVTTGWNVGGSATVVDSTIRLTTATTTQSGYVYYNTPVNLTSCGQFTVDFDFKIVVTAASMVADGIAFWYISNPPSAFVSGGGIGLPSNPNGLIMIMDTYDNAAPTNVPLATLLGYNGTVAGYTEGDPTGVLAPVVPSLNFITDGTWHHCKITYNLGNVNVYFNNSSTASMTGYYPLSISGYFGFSSSTGAAYSTQSVKSIYITAAGTSVPPTVVSPVTYCQGDAAIPLTATPTPGGTLSWFTTDTATVVALPGAPTPSTGTVGTTTYYVRQGSGSCISNPDSIKVIVSPHPAAPVVSGPNAYCSGTPFVPFTITGATGSLLWYNVPTGGTGSSTTPAVPTATPGVYDYWVSQTVAGCEGARDSIRVKVTTTPPTPSITGATQYCQYIGPYVPVTVTTVPTGSALWYTAPTGGTGTPATPTVDINFAGAYNYYLSQLDSGCESSRLPVTIDVHPKPMPPGVTPLNYCQYAGSGPLTASGSNLTWYGPGLTTGYTTAPIPATAVMGTDSFYVTQTSTFGCVSDSAYFPVKIVPHPAAPVTADTAYCRLSQAPALTAIGSNLKWYSAATGGLEITPAPVPPTTSLGTTTWYVTQTVDGCESDRTPLNIEILYLPNFTITPDKPFVCQFDSLTLNYTSPDNVNVTYAWTLPVGASFANNTGASQSTVMVQFDSAYTGNFVHLSATDMQGKCKADTSLRINVVELPTAHLYIKPEICMNEEVALALSYRSVTADDFTWRIDDTLMKNSSAISIITYNSDHGGPYTVSWNRTGTHVVQLNTYTLEGCTSMPVFDTVNIHRLPDARFSYAPREGKTELCYEDSAWYAATAPDQRNLYQWLPGQYFDNINSTPAVWGKVPQNNELVKLTVIDPYGCTASSSKMVEAKTCCNVVMPNAFTPNGDHRDDVFRPIVSGYHRYHAFRVANRWGQTIFESTNSNPSWDGTYNGEPQDLGVYYYYVKFDCGGEVVEQHGDVTLIR